MAALRKRREHVEPAPELLLLGRLDGACARVVDVLGAREVSRRVRVAEGGGRGTGDGGGPAPSSIIFCKRAVSLLMKPPSAAALSITLR